MPRYPAQRILVIATRQIGDVLLVTPLIHSLRLAYPQAKIDALVFEGKEHILHGNPDIQQILTIPERPSLYEHLRLLTRITRRYDLAIPTLSGDRPALYALFAARTRVAIVPPERKQDAWKRWSAAAWAELDDTDTHTVIQNLRLADQLEIPRSYQVILPQSDEAATKLSKRLPFDWQQAQYAVLHLTPMWHYKRWTLEGWGALANYLHTLGWEVVLTGSQAPAEQLYLQQAMQHMPHSVVNVAGHFDFAAVSLLLQHAQAYVGPDTAVTHLAAASGTPTVALFGPTNPVKWGPWPAHYAQDKNPYQRVGTQIVGNVALVQGQGDCVPCHLEGCDQHRESASACLDQLSVDLVEQALNRVLDQHTLQQSLTSH